MILRKSIFGATLLLATPVFLPPPDLAAANAQATARTGRDPSGEAIQKAVDAVYPALVRIHVVYEEGDSGRMTKRRSSGSGAIISEDGYIVTNHHVAGRATRLVCRLSNREEVDAVLVGTDPLSDLSVLKLDLSSRRNPKEKPVVASLLERVEKAGMVQRAAPEEGRRAHRIQIQAKGQTLYESALLPDACRAAAENR